MSENLDTGSRWEKIKNDPLPLLGMTGFFGIVAVSLLNYRKKKASTATSMYVIQTRVAAQGLVIGVLTLGVGYSMISKMIKNYSETQTFLPNFDHTHDKSTK